MHQYDYSAVNLQTLYQPPALGHTPDPGFVSTYNKDHQLLTSTDPDGRTVTI